VPIIEHRNLSAELIDQIRDQIIAGQLEPGRRLNEVHLAARLEVSRTPLREALAGLVSEGLVVSRARRGFFVQALEPDQLEELYRIRAILDPAALELAGLPSSAQLDQLDALNAALAASAGGAGRTIELDDRWHLELLAGCPNRILLDLIRQFMRRTRPYEHAYMRDTVNVAATVTEHERILSCLRSGDLPAAIATLRQNMQTAVGPLLSWLAVRRSR